MTRTVRTADPVWGIIADMVRVLGRLAAWLAGTALAVALAWLGASMVVRNTTASPSPPEVSVAPTGVSSGAPASTAPARPVSPTAPARHAPRPAPTPTANGDVRDYALAGGQVTLLVSQTSAKLVAAVPDAGDSVQTWSGIDWLRVDFSSGPQVSSLIANWNGHAPSVTVGN
jgi:hypothetical protein